jgi:hypothetical protein
MFTCANCPNSAHYTYRVGGSDMIHYCSRHLPKFLVHDKNAGLLELYVPPKPAKKKPAPVEDAVEDVVEEDTPTEE